MISSFLGDGTTNGIGGGLRPQNFYLAPRRHLNSWRFLHVVGTFMAFSSFSVNLKGEVFENFCASLTVGAFNDKPLRFFHWHYLCSLSLLFPLPSSL